MSGSSLTRIDLAGFGAWGQIHARAISEIGGAEVGAVLCRSEAAKGSGAGDATASGALYRLRDDAC